MRRPRLVILAACVWIAGCAGSIVRPTLSPSRPGRDALLILPGFGYSRAGEKAMRALAVPLAGEGVDLFVPTYVSRGGIAESRSTLQQFIRDRRLDQYDRLHVFAFIAGAWTFNPLVTIERPPNLATLIYDRSPYQERAPRIAAEKLRLFTWLRYGSPVFEVARTPYPSLATSDVKVGIVVETRPTSFIKRHRTTARSYGPFRFACDVFMQPYQDCLYVDMSHDELYVRFAELWPELFAFIRTGRFTNAANRAQPAGDALGRDGP